MRRRRRCSTTCSCRSRVALVADGAYGERGALVGQRPPRRPGPRRPGDRTTGLSVRATVRAAARSGRPLAQELRTQARRPTATLDVVLALDVSGSMLGARTGGWPRRSRTRWRAAVIASRCWRSPRR
ncbi:MAG: hypothetical protein U0S48_11070 [Solirubrobacteraceae bacterium]